MGEVRPSRCGWLWKLVLDSWHLVYWCLFCTCLKFSITEGFSYKKKKLSLHSLPKNPLPISSSRRVSVKESLFLFKRGFQVPFCVVAVAFPVLCCSHADTAWGPSPVARRPLTELYAQGRKIKAEQADFRRVQRGLGPCKVTYRGQVPSSEFGLQQRP